MRKKFWFHEEEGEESPINLTPLIDVVFVLLITFMLLAPILHVDHVELATSGILNKSQPEQTLLTLSIKADNTIWFQGKKLEASQIKSVLQAEKKRNQQPQLIADKNCHFGTYQDVKNLFEECGFQQLDVVLK